MESRISRASSGLMPFAFSGQVECFSKRRLELRFRIAGNQEDKILCDVNSSFFLNHTDADCVIPGVQDVGAMSGRAHERRMNVFNKFSAGHIFCGNGKTRASGAKTLWQRAFAGKLV